MAEIIEVRVEGIGRYARAIAPIDVSLDLHELGTGVRLCVDGGRFSEYQAPITLCAGDSYRLTIDGTRFRVVGELRVLEAPDV